MPSDHYLFTLDPDGNPVPCLDSMEFAHWFHTANRRVAEDLDEAHNARISTVFLGMLHGYDGTGRPLLWETMVFGGRLSGTCKRYATRDEAVIGHAETVCEVLTTPE